MPGKIGDCRLVQWKDAKLEKIKLLSNTVQPPKSSKSLVLV
jgi:hypothetical protein